MLRKIRNNTAQSGTGDAKKRRENVKGVYETLSEEEIAGRRILLVDDIVTTGATLSECASILKKAGAKEVSAVTLARRKE
jgi:predicted amidophosphoribosyltransferase